MDDKQQKNLILKGLSEAEVCAEFVVKYFGVQERDAKLKQVEDAVKNLCMLDSHIKERIIIVDNMKNEEFQKRAALEENEGDVVLEMENVDKFDGELEERMTTAMGKVDINKHQMMCKFQEKVKNFIKKADKAGQSDNQDEELVFTEESETHIDPITKTTIVDPVFSKTCKHKFSRDSITQQINAHPQKYTKCPYVGCNKRIAERDLEDDFELAQILDRMKHLVAQ